MAAGTERSEDQQGLPWQRQPQAFQTDDHPNRPVAVGGNQALEILRRWPAHACLLVSCRRPFRFDSWPWCLSRSLLEVRRHPDLVRDEHGQVCAHLCELADRGAELDDAACLGCPDRRVGQVQLRLVALGLSLARGSLRRSRAGR